MKIFKLLMLLLIFSSSAFANEFDDFAIKNGFSTENSMALWEAGKDDKKNATNVGTVYYKKEGDTWDFMFLIYDDYILEVGQDNFIKVVEFTNNGNQDKYEIQQDDFFTNFDSKPDVDGFLVWNIPLAYNPEWGIDVKITFDGNSTARISTLIENIPDTAIPIDGGISILLAAGVGFGGWFVRKFKAQS